MARQRDPNRDKAFEIYKEHNGEITNRAIAEMLDVLEKTISAWKSRDKWVKQLNGDECSTTKEKCSTTKDNRTKKQPASSSVVDDSDIIITNIGESGMFEDEPLNGKGFTDRQRLFISFYVKYWNATRAYKKAYQCDYVTANVNGPRLLGNASIREEIVKVRDSLTEDALLTKRVLVQKWKDIAFADITDYVQFGREEEIAYDEGGLPKIDANGNPKTYTYSYVRLNDSAEVDGTLITEVKQGKDGISIKLADKMTALKYLSQHLDVLNEREKKWLQEEQLRLNIEKTKAETERLKKINEAGDQQSTEEKLAEYFTVLQGAFTNAPTDE